MHNPAGPLHRRRAAAGTATPAPPPLPPLSEPTEADLRSLLRIRHFELSVLGLFTAGKLAGTTHTAIGQEYIPVALNALLSPHDTVLSNHRGHAHYLARYPDCGPLLAEILGRHGALGNGVGGSQHLHRKGFWSTGVQGETVPLATGMALDTKRAGSGALVLVYIGDGSWGEGAIYEALNIASLWELPLVVAVENNGIAQTTPVSRNTAGSIAARAHAFGISHRLVTTLDLNVVRTELAPELVRVRRLSRPLVVEFVTTRVGPHSKGDDTRTAAELTAVRARDWYRRYPLVCPQLFAMLDTQERELMAALVERCGSAPLSRWERKEGNRL